MANSIFKQLRARDVKFVDLRVVDLGGKVRHFTYNLAALNEASLAHGMLIDGSFLVGDQQPVLLKPDLSAMFIDPLFVETTAVFWCELWDEKTDSNHVLDVRGVARRAAEYLAKSKVAQQLQFGVELGFFLFDDVRYTNTASVGQYSLDAECMASNSGRQYESGNLGHRANSGQGYGQLAPMDDMHDLRSEICMVLEQIGIVTISHHPGAASGQCGIELQKVPLLVAADNIQKCKYVVHNIARSYNKSATFMPQPLAGDSGSYMHLKQSLWQSGKALFTSSKSKNTLSQHYTHYIGGLRQYKEMLYAFTNPTTNSYRRLRSLPCDAGCGAKLSSSAINGEVIASYPDPAANPYLAFAAMLMVGAFGIHNEINSEKNRPERHSKTCGGSSEPSLQAALKALDQNRSVLKEGGVFTDAIIDAYISLKQKEIDLIERAPTPKEFELYYSC